MKYLLIGAVLAFVLLYLYKRIRPYVQLLRKVAAVLKSPVANTHDLRSVPASDRKLVRCVNCGTWVPAGRAFGNKQPSETYCSVECLKKGSSLKRRKAAG